MLAFIRKYRTHIWVAIAIAAVVAFVYTSETMQQCIDNPQKNYETKPPKERPSLLYVHIDCAWALLHRNSESLIALFTIVIGVFTLALFLDGRDKARKELRAYLGGTKGTLNFLTDTVLRAEIIIKNSGQTPAHNCTFAIAGELRAPNDTRPFEKASRTHGRQPIAPGAEWIVGYEFLKLNDADVRDIRTDKKYVYIWGWAEYFDIFGHRQEVEFRYRNIIKVVNFQTGHIGGWKFYPEDEGNKST